MKQERRPGVFREAAALRGGWRELATWQSCRCALRPCSSRTRLCGRPCCPGCSRSRVLYASYADIGISAIGLNRFAVFV
jgi:hypothetical protein